MEGTNRDSILPPSWLPVELQQYAAKQLRRHDPNDLIERYRQRLLTDSRMKEVWPWFLELPATVRKRAMVDFLKTAPLLFDEGKSKRISKKERELLRKLKRRLPGYTNKIAAIVEQVDALGVLASARKTSLLKRVRYIERVLSERISSYKTVDIADLMWGEKYEILGAQGKRGSEDIAYRYTREGVSILFGELLGQPLNRLANIVCFVMDGIPTPATLTAEQLRNQTRKRRENLSRRKNRK